MRKESNSLNGLTQTHFVCKDSVDTLIVEVVKPLKTFKLICFEVTSEHLWLLDFLVEDIMTLKLLLVKVININLISVVVVKVIKTLSVLVNYSCDILHGCSPVYLNSMLAWRGIKSIIFLLLGVLISNTKLGSHKVCVDFRLLHQILKTLLLQESFLLFLLPLFLLLVHFLSLFLGISHLLISLFPVLAHFLGLLSCPLN